MPTIIKIPGGCARVVDGSTVAECVVRCSPRYEVSCGLTASRGGPKAGDKIRINRHKILDLPATTNPNMLASLTRKFGRIIDAY